MPWSTQNTEASEINVGHFYKEYRRTRKDRYYKSLCGHFFLKNISLNRKPKNKCKICQRIKGEKK